MNVIMMHFQTKSNRCEQKQAALSELNFVEYAKSVYPLFSQFTVSSISLTVN